MKKSNGSSGFFKNPQADLAEIRTQFELFGLRLEESYLLASQAGDVRGMVATLGEVRKHLESRLDRLEKSVDAALSGRRKLTVEDWDEVITQMENVKNGRHLGPITVPLLRKSSEDAQ